MSSKLFLGHRLRRLRRDHQMSQTDMATSLAISPSYLNHLERNQRPVTAALLLKLAEQFEVDVRSFAANGGGAKTGPDALVEIFSDVLLSDLGVPRYELVELANNAPSIADAIARLYTALKEATRNPEIASAGDARSVVTPENWVRDYIQQHRNHYPDLDIRFFAMKEGSGGRVVILPRGDKSGRTSRLFELGALPEIDSMMLTTELTKLLTTRIEGAVKEFLQAWNSA